MGFWSWLLNKPSKRQGRKIHKRGASWGRTRRERNLRDQMRAAGVNPDLALCPECGEWYNVNNRAAVDRHAH